MSDWSFRLYFGVVGILGIGGILHLTVITGCYDRVAVALMRRFDVRLYPEAVAIALLIYQHPEQWSCGEHKMLHPKVGAIWTSNEAYGLHIKTEFGDWKPNAIERRIIRDAVDWRIKTYVRGRIGQALNTGVVTGRVTDG